jgi:putative oxidoreductase
MRAVPAPRKVAMAFVRVRSLNLALAVLFVALGLAKLFGLAPWRESFFAWSYPSGFRYLVGFVEVCAGGCLLLPRAVPAGAATLGLVMLGAIGTHLRSGETLYALIPATLFVLLANAGLRAWRAASGRG